jgi:endonuclease/exonuclease/phosphatase (EEP) superfamily protein YafD
MNTPYGNENYRLLTAGLTDVSGTEPTLHPTFHKVGKNGYHVDYVFLKGEKLDALETRIPVVDASDHLPVVVELATSD